MDATTTADLADLRLAPGVYAGPDKSPLSLTGPLVLDGGGDLRAVFIFQTNSTAPGVTPITSPAAITTVVPPAVVPTLALLPAPTASPASGGGSTATATATARTQPGGPTGGGGTATSLTTPGRATGRPSDRPAVPAVVGPPRTGGAAPLATGTLWLALLAAVGLAGGAWTVPLLRRRLVAGRRRRAVGA